MKKYIIELTPEERESLQEIVAKGKTSARKIQHAQILLKADETEGGPAWKDDQIAEAYGISVRSVERIRQRCVENGWEDALVRRQSSSGPHRKKLDGKGEAYLCKLACSKPPQGRERWTICLLRDRLVELNIVDSIGREAVRTTLKKTK
jgi:transposase